jgi:hypothetical protein
VAIGFDLLGGTQPEQAKKVGGLLNGHVLDVFVTEREGDKGYWGAAMTHNHLFWDAPSTGDKATAHQRYEQFLTLWKNADPGRPEVTTAKEFLAQRASGSGVKFLVGSL